MSCRWIPCARCGKARRLGTKRAHAECEDCRKGYVPRRTLRMFPREWARRIALAWRRCAA